MKKRWINEFILNPSLYRTIYIIILFFTLVLFVDMFAIGIACLFFAISPVIIYKNFIADNNFVKIPFYKILIFFSICSLITLLTNITSNFVFSFCMVLHNIFCFILFYGMSAATRSTNGSLKKEMFTLFGCIVLLSTVCSLIGLVFAFSKSDISVPICNINSKHLKDYVNLINPNSANEYITVGFLDNRFVGIFSNSNLQGFCNCISLVFSHIILKKDNLPGSLKVLIYFSFIINGASLLLTDSNASLLFVIIYYTVLWFYKLILSFDSEVINGRKIRIMEFLKKTVIWSLACIFLFISVFKCRDTFQSIVAKSISCIQNKQSSQEIVIDNSIDNQQIIVSDNEQVIDKSIEIIENDSNIDDEVEQSAQYEADESNSSEPQNMKIGRENYDISSGRFILWKQAFKIFIHHPVFGIARGNIIYYGQRYLKNGILCYDLHNGYLTVLVCYGMAGFLSLLLFAFCVLIKLSNKLLRCAKKNDNGVFPCLFSLVIAFGVHSLFEKAILSEPSFMCVVFWLVLGYAINYTSIE